MRTSRTVLLWQQQEQQNSGLAPGQQNRGICASGAAVILMSGIIYLQADGEIVDKVDVTQHIPTETLTKQKKQKLSLPLFLE